MKQLLLLFIFLPIPLKASPITGAFTTGTMNSTTTTTQTIVESIVSKDYNSGYTIQCFWNWHRTAEQR